MIINILWIKLSVNMKEAYERGSLYEDYYGISDNLREILVYFNLSLLIVCFPINQKITYKRVAEFDKGSYWT